MDLKAKADSMANFVIDSLNRIGSEIGDLTRVYVSLETYEGYITKVKQEMIDIAFSNFFRKLEHLQEDISESYNQGGDESIHGGDEGSGGSGEFGNSYRHELFGENDLGYGSDDTDSGDGTEGGQGMEGLEEAEGGQSQPGEPGTTGGRDLWQDGVREQIPDGDGESEGRCISL